MTTKPMRPIGITVLSILAGIAGVLMVMGGVLVAALASVITDLIEANVSTLGLAGMGIDFGAFFAAALMAFAVIALIFGVLHLVVAYGFWVGAGWSRWLAIVLSILGIIGGIITLPGGIVPIIIYGVIIWYLMQPYVKTFFGQGPSSVPPPSPPPV
jgi:uncharacterized membrane protein (DUF2068 family)